MKAFNAGHAKSEKQFQMKLRVDRKGEHFEMLNLIKH
jgi:hypothetical protein